MNEQNDSVSDRRRVSAAISGIVKEFCSTSKVFKMAELTEFVATRFDGKLAPDSPGRILRMLKQKGEVKYNLVDRRSSTYEIPNA